MVLAIVIMLSEINIFHDYHTYASLKSFEVWLPEVIFYT